jgi:hypothetical protein
MRPARVLGLRDRLQDVWAPLFAIADLGGADWPDRATAAALHLAAAGQEPTESLRVRLLADIRLALGADLRLWTRDLVARLTEDSEAPWGDLRGKPLTDRTLARFLKPFHVRPKPIRIGDEVFRGFERAQFEDAWSRYLPSSPSPDVTALQPASPKGEQAIPERYSDPCVTLTDSASNPHGKPGVTDVTDRKALPGDPGFLDAVLAAHAAGFITTGEALERQRTHEFIVAAGVTT